MFETAGELWEEYLTQVSSKWEEDDPRRSHGAEVMDRLRQLDLILKHLCAAIDSVTPDPVAIQKRMEFIHSNFGRMANGEITQEEYDRGSMLVQDPDTLTDSWDDVWIFTETFYFYAWRVRQVLNNQKRDAFPEVGKVKAYHIHVARNHLIEHPENSRDGQAFYQGIFLTSSGPVLRSRNVVVRLVPGQLDPSSDEKDPGLFVSAEKFREELERRFTGAISKTRLRPLIGRHLLCLRRILVG